jgi:CheY-like chemotaxis protein
MKSNSPRDDMYLGGVSVLVVDDYEPVRTVVAAMLEHCGATVTAVSSADEALEALKRERPDVLVSDLAMPDKGGYWLIGQVRALPPEQGGASLRPPSPDSVVPNTGRVSCALGSSTTSKSRSCWRTWSESSRSSR